MVDVPTWLMKATRWYSVKKHKITNRSGIRQNRNCQNCKLSLLIAVAKYSNDTAQQGRTESRQRRPWQPLYGPRVTLEHSLQPDGISCMPVFAKGGKPDNPEKNPWSREENQHKLNPLMASGPGIEPEPHWWEASAITTAPSLLPSQH